jgi:ribosomal protein L17
MKRVRNLVTGAQKTENRLRNFLTSLVAHWQMVTTQKKAQVIKATANSFFARLVRMYNTRDEADARRESIRLIKATIYTEAEGKKLLDELMPRWVEKWVTSSFVMNVKIWPRSWDAAEQVLIKLI